MILTYPDDSLQYMITPDQWWVEDENYSFARGRLVWAFIPHVEQNPYTLIPTGRKEPTIHSEAKVKILPLNIRQIIRYPQLPVAALPQFNKEVFTVYRAKKRPAVIISGGGSIVDQALTKGKPKRHYAPTVLVAPFYGGDQEGQRAGFLPAFIERVRRCEYPQFMWDRLPLDSSTNESILRFDHIQPVGRSEDALEITKYRLSQTALLFFDEWLDWIMTGEIKSGSLLGEYREDLIKIQTCY
jgi:hypothetical protein